MKDDLPVVLVTAAVAPVPIIRFEVVAAVAVLVVLDERPQLPTLADLAKHVRDLRVPTSPSSARDPRFDDRGHFARIEAKRQQSLRSRRR